MLRFLTILALTTQLTTLALSQARSTLEGRDLIVHTLSRLTFGADAALVDEVQKQGLDRWLKEQLQHTEADPKLARQLEVWPFLNMSSQEIYAWVGEQRDRRRLVESGLPASILLRGARNRWQVSEVMADFWRNHFNVDRAKGSVMYTAVEYDREVLRKNVFGKFEDMLKASARHPAMLVYLDNYISRRPPTKTELKTVARRVRRKTGSKARGEEAAGIAAQRGLNENYARELMELHTLGVDNGYSQKDVIEVARALTGWTVDTKDNKYAFLYRDDMHDRGDKFVLGKTIRREKRRNGMVEGEKIIHVLAQHRNTSVFLARKLCTYLVADDPPARLVGTTARVLRERKFDLSAALLHIVKSKEFRDRQYYRAKFKTPFEFVLSALRVSGAVIDDPRELVRRVAEMGQPIYRCEDPTGYRDTAESWRDPGVMAARWKFALDLALGRIEGVRVPETFFAELDHRSVPALVASMGARLLPGGMRGETIRVLIKVARRHRLAEKEGEEEDLPPLERHLLGVVLGSPEFQEQ